jgi:phage shock protein C
MVNQTRTPRLYRSKQNALIAGVAGGIAEYFGVDPTLVRIVMFLAFLFTVGPFGLVVYAILAWIIPARPFDETATPPASSPYA